MTTCHALAVVPLFFSALALAAAPPPPAKATFDLQEVSALKESGQWYRLLRGQYAECKTAPLAAVKKYPAMKSKRPLYGSVIFDRNAQGSGGIEYHFALDESGAAPPKTIVPRPASLPYYDILYFDANRDLDLTNDPPIRLMKDPPKQAIPGSDAQGTNFFDYVTLQFDYGPDIGTRPFRVLPRVTADGTYAALYFISPAARKATIELAGRQYNVLLAQAYLINGRFDRPFTYTEFAPAGTDPDQDHWWGHDQLSALRIIGDQAYTLSVTPLGDKLTVSPYTGDYGIFAVGPGPRKIDKMAVMGSLTGRDMNVPLGSTNLRNRTAQRECRIPVGEYLPNYIHVEYGKLRIGISYNYHGDGTPRDRQGRPQVFGMKVTKDKPFILDFTNKPEVMFASPARNQTFKPGEEIRIAAVLTDPVLDFMIRDLEDTTQAQQQKTTGPNGQETSYTRPLSLDPIVTITDSSKKTVFTGKMPFG